jgi:hypothetical protein
MALPPIRLRSLLDDLLDAAVAALTPVLTDPGPQPSGAPGKVFVSQGPPVPECQDGQLSTHVAYVRFEGDRSGACYVQPVYGLVVALYRCVPTVAGNGTLPTDEALTESAEGLAVDAQALVERLVGDCASTFPSLPQPCAAVTWLPGLLPARTEGGLGGWTLGLEVRP